MQAPGFATTAKVEAFTAWTIRLGDVADDLPRFINAQRVHSALGYCDLGGGDTMLCRLVDQLPELAQMASDEGSAVVMFYHVGPQVDDLSPVATMEERGFQPEATAIVMNEAGVDPGLTGEQAFARIHKHRVFREAIGRGAVPMWMPRLLVADAIAASAIQEAIRPPGGHNRGLKLSTPRGHSKL